MSSSGAYKFDNYNEKLPDEVGTVGNEYENMSHPEANPLYATSTTGRTMMPKPETVNQSKGGGNKVVIIMLIVVISLLMVLVVMGAYIITQQSTGSKCTCDVANNDEVTGTQQPTVGTQAQMATCNTTEMQAYLNQVIKAMNGSCQSVLQLLQDKQDADMDYQTNATEMMSNTEDSLEHIINTLSNHKDTSISTSSAVDDILIGVNELLYVHNTSSLYDSITPVSCKQIKEKLPDSPSGFYHVNNRDIYCNMDELCGSSGGWTRLAYLDMTDSTEDCPDEWQYYTSSGLRMCEKKEYSPGCSSPVKFPSNGISYSEICGRVTGYQKGSPDAVAASTHGPISAHNDLNSYYVDGISLTKGSPREHVWTFMAGLRQDFYSIYNCPCSTPPGETQQVQSFVGSHYFCESANPTTAWTGGLLYSTDPLWDGKGCGNIEGPCCSVDGLPWFHRQYDNTTTDSLDMRICGDENTANENTPISFYEIFVK